MKKQIKLAVLSAIMLCSTQLYARQASMQNQTGETVFTKTVTPGSVTLDVAVPQARTQSQTVLAAESGDTYAVTISIDPDNNGKNKTPQGVWLIKDEFLSYQSMRKSINKFNVPAGDYIAQIIFTGDEGAGTIMFIDVKVDGPKDIHVNASMATKTVTTEFTLPSGDKAVLPEDDGTGHIADKPYSIYSITADIHLTYHGISKGSVQAVVGMGGADYSKYLTFKTNVDNSHGEAYFVVRADAPGKEGAKYFYLVSTKMDKVSDSVVLTNDDYTFNKVSDTEIVRSPAYEIHGNGNKTYGLYYYAYGQDGEMLGGVSTETEGANDLYICSPAIDFNGLHALAQIYTYDYADEDEWIYSGISTPYFAYNGNKIEYYATPANAYACDGPAWDKTVHNPALSFERSEGISFGDNFAVCVTTVETDSWAEPPFSYLNVDSYFGNYGELRSIDNDVYSFSVKHNGSPVEVAEGDDVYDWAEKWSTNDHSPGVLTYTFTNTNLSVDGLPGKNICEVSFTEGAEDVCPPTLQRLMIRDANGVPAIKFDSAAGATLTVAGGDFVARSESKDAGGWDMSFDYYTFAEADCKAEYAAHGSSDYHEFALENDAQKFFMPGFGKYFSGSLEQITVPSTDKWYDLKITFTDEAGNTQIQTISPAFRIEELSAGIDEIESDVAEFAVIDGTIVSTDGSVVRIFTLSGVQIANSDLYPGLYIAVSADRRAKVAVK